MEIVQHWTFNVKESGDMEAQQLTNSAMNNLTQKDRWTDIVELNRARNIQNAIQSKIAQWWLIKRFC